MTTADTDSHDEYATWDGPYVLGALDREQRLEFEAHLSECAECRAAVAELSGLPGLLRQVRGDVALSLIDTTADDSRADFGDAGFDALLDRVRAAEGHPGGAADGILPFEAGRGASAAPAEPEPDRVTPPSAETTAGSTEIGRDTAPRSLAAARERRRRRSGPWLALAGAVAAAAAAVAITIPVTISNTESHTPPTAEQVVTERQMDQVAPSPITASFSLTQLDSGTRVNMSCSYAPSDTDYTWDGALWVVHTDGTQSMISQWSAHPGQTVTADGITSAPADQIRYVEIRSSTTNQVFLRGNV
ncbi:anti-sigma factor family protein [Nocardia veterana]|uniref:anti-sigma factor family protein n=1 Tax=Nocardia veterana TaxID=132249 RepID=UPI0002E37A45|nr:zf-HC2 domain-containing protein [Nocardia veterana]